MHEILEPVRTAWTNYDAMQRLLDVERDLNSTSTGYAERQSITGSITSDACQ